ncbi:MAG: nucleotide exchange factor GrpE [Alphaproteobacteria bacterium]
MSDKDANKAQPGETTAEAGAETPPETPPETQVDARPETPGADELMPGLADAVAAAVVEAGAVAELEAECIRLKDRLLRALAESENVRRRAERDRKDAETYGGTRLARDLLAVHDNLDRALSHVDEALREQAKGFIEGMELTRRELLAAFAKHKIEKVSPATGEKFDPHRHQAMFEAPVPGAEPGTVIEVMQAGFTIANRLLRPALVGVARAAPEAVPEPAETDPAPVEGEGE